MDQFIHPLYNQHLYNVIKSFQSSAGRSLRGPGGYLSAWGDQGKSEIKMSTEDYEEYKRALDFAMKSRATANGQIPKDSQVVPTPLPVKMMPILFPMDTSTKGLSETPLEGEHISCFEIGGEKRLCLPQILNTVLRKFSMEEVHEATTKLNIFFSRCTPEQLTHLKCSKVLPSSAQNCGLITKTDAERLANKLLHGDEHFTESPGSFSTNSFKVYHECFGKCKGLFDPDLYVREDSACIQCCECRRLMTPQKFVCHNHKALENRVCHWGFDSSNWRSYLLLAKDQEHLHSIVKCLEEVKDRFSKTSRKRKQDVDGGQEEKRSRAVEESLPKWPRERLPSDLNQSPPVVLNPEKIVPFSGHDRYDRDFVPNISLAPSSAPKKKRDHDACSRATDGDDEAEDDEPLDIDVSSADSDSDDSAASLDTDVMDTAAGATEAEWLRSGREREWALVQQALEGRVGGDKASQEAFIQQYIDSRAAEQQALHTLSQARQHLRQELAGAREKKREFAGEVHQWRRSAEQERAENERLRRQLQDMRELHARELSQQSVKFEGELSELKTHVAQQQQVQVQLTEELRYLREKLRTSNNNVDVKHETEAAPAVTPLSPNQDTMSAKQASVSPNQASLLAAALHSPPKPRTIVISPI